MVINRGYNKNGRISKKALGWMERHREAIEEFFYRDHVKVTGMENIECVVATSEHVPLRYRLRYWRKGWSLDRSFHSDIPNLLLPLKSIDFNGDRVIFDFYSGILSERIAAAIVALRISGKKREGYVHTMYIMAGDSLRISWNWNTGIKRWRQMWWKLRAQLKGETHLGL